MYKLLPGQALVEMLIAIAVITVALIAMVSLATKSLSNANFSQSQSVALSIATRAIECIRTNRQNMTWDDFYADPGINCSNPPPSGYALIISPTQTSGPPPKMTVVVTVSWTDSKGVHNSTQTTEFINY